MGSSLTKREVMEIAGVSADTVERRAEELQPAAGPVGRNGKPEPVYDVARLPVEVQRKWAREQRRKVVQMAAPAAGSDAQIVLDLTAPVGPNLSEEDRREADRRFAIIEPLVAPEKYPLLYAQYKRQADLMAYLVAAHKAQPAKKVRLSVRTLYGWLKAWKRGGLPALVRKDRADKGELRLATPAARELVLELALPKPGAYGAYSVAEMCRAYEDERAWRAERIGQVLPEHWRERYSRYLDEECRLVPEALPPKVSERTMCVWFKRIPEMVRTQAREGAEAFHNSQAIISHRDIGAIEPMDYVVMDHRVLDIFCLVRDPGRGGAGWRLVRPWLTAAIDMRTRLWLGWCIVEQPASDSIACALKKVIVAYGVPKGVYWDNGKDFQCEWFEGSTRQARRTGKVEELDGVWRGVLATLGIRATHAIPYNARAKIIEPNFNRISNVDRALAEWCGHNAAARPERFEAMVKDHERWTKGEIDCTPFRTIEQVATLYNAAIRDLNERPMEGAEGMRKVAVDGYGWMTPGEAWEVFGKDVPRRDAPPDVLAMCFAKRKKLTVQHGEVSTTLDARPYHYRLADNSCG